MEPFDQYPSSGRELLGKRTGANARHEYGLRLQRVTGISTCAYCGLDFTARYHDWLTMQVDHVVPVSDAVRLNIPIAFYEDMVNLVLACSACNGFDNRYVGSGTARDEWDLAAFLAVRDAAFVQRSQRIRARHERERSFFDSAPWTIP